MPLKKFGIKLLNMEQIKLEKKLIQDTYRENISRIVVGAIIIKKPAKILILRRNVSDFLGGIDELPSGEVEKGESLITALKREILEETGLVIKEVLEYLGYFDYVSRSGKPTRQFNFAVTVLENKVKINPEEHQTYKWIDINKLTETGLTKNVIDVILKYKFN